MKVRAKFKGRDGSLGYILNKTYDLWFFTTDNFPMRIEICKLSDFKSGVCQYSSLKSFLKNWEVL